MSYKFGLGFDYPEYPESHANKGFISCSSSKSKTKIPFIMKQCNKYVEVGTSRDESCSNNINQCDLSNCTSNMTINVSKNLVSFSGNSVSNVSKISDNCSKLKIQKPEHVIQYTSVRPITHSACDKTKNSCVEKDFVCTEC